MISTSPQGGQASASASASSSASARTRGTVRIVGTGLLGASIGLGLSARGVDVALDDHSPAERALAIDYGAGRAAQDGDEVHVVVVAVPPDVTAQVVARELAAHPTAVVTDVASVKAPIRDALERAGADLGRYVGGHPMAGRERGGASSARADLFLGRTWVIVPATETQADAVRALEDLASDLEALPITLPAVEHDADVALSSHVPQIVASALAARFIDGSESVAQLVGQGGRDMTRLAASDPSLWVQILSANAQAITPVLEALRRDLDRMLVALADTTAPGALRTIAELLNEGRTGVARIPGKHGTRQRYASVTVLIDDSPGQLAKLLTDIGDAGINMEDMRLEHSPGAPIGIVEISVLPSVRQQAEDVLRELGWRMS